MFFFLFRFHTQNEKPKPGTNPTSPSDPGCRPSLRPETEVSRPLASKNWPKELQFSALDVAHTVQLRDERI